MTTTVQAKRARILRLIQEMREEYKDHRGKHVLLARVTELIVETASDNVYDARVDDLSEAVGD